MQSTAHPAPPAVFSASAVSALLSRWWAPIHVQEATPAAGPVAVIELAPGVTAELFGGAPSARAPEQTVYLARFVFQPSVEIFPHSYPGSILLEVDSGELGWTLQQGAAHDVRGAGSGGTETEDITELGTEVILAPGDAIHYEDDVIHTARGASDAPTVVFSTLILEAGQPLLIPAEMDMSATLAP